MGTRGDETAGARGNETASALEDETAGTGGRDGRLTVTRGRGGRRTRGRDGRRTGGRDGRVRPSHDTLSQWDDSYHHGDSDEWQWQWPLLGCRDSDTVSRPHGRSALAVTPRVPGQSRWEPGPLTPEEPQRSRHVVLRAVLALQNCSKNPTLKTSIQ